jgi:hypothetical protein
MKPVRARSEEAPAAEAEAGVAATEEAVAAMAAEAVTVAEVAVAGIRNHL